MRVAVKPVCAQGGTPAKPGGTDSIDLLATTPSTHLAQAMCALDFHLCQFTPQPSTLDPARGFRYFFPGHLTAILIQRNHTSRLQNGHQIPHFHHAVHKENRHPRQEDDAVAQTYAGTLHELAPGAPRRAFATFPALHTTGKVTSIYTHIGVPFNGSANEGMGAVLFRGLEQRLTGREQQITRWWSLGNKVPEGVGGESNSSIPEPAASEQGPTRWHGVMLWSWGKRI